MPKWKWYYQDVRLGIWTISIAQALSQVDVFFVDSNSLAFSSNLIDFFILINFWLFSMLTKSRLFYDSQSHGSFTPQSFVHLIQLSSFGTLPIDLIFQNKDFVCFVLGDHWNRINYRWPLIWRIAIKIYNIVNTFIAELIELCKS